MFFKGKQWKNALLAVILSLIILLGWSYFSDKPVPQKSKTAEQAPLKLSLLSTETQQPPVQTVLEPAVTGGTTASDITVETDLYKAVFSTEGATIKSWELKTYKDSQKLPVVL
jgi:YidC/Oxa1 family membrane protein insertase